MLYSAPHALCQPLLGLNTKALVGACAALRPGPLTSTTAATKTTLWTLARRWQQLQASSTNSTASSRPWSPRPRPPCWHGPGSGSTPPGSCWSRRRQPQRLGSEPAFAHLFGTAPIPPPRAAPTAIG